MNPYIYYFSQVNSASITNKAIGGATYATAHTPNIMTELEDYKMVYLEGLYLKDFPNQKNLHPFVINMVLKGEQLFYPKIEIKMLV